MARAIHVGDGPLIQAPPATPVQRYGHLDARRHHVLVAAFGQPVLIFLDGVDVTDVCTEADDLARYVVLAPQHRDYSETVRAAVAAATRAVTMDTGWLKVWGDVLIRPAEPGDACHVATLPPARPATWFRYEHHGRRDLLEYGDQILDSCPPAAVAGANDAGGDKD